MRKLRTDLLETYAQKLADKPVTHLWFGFGSSLFIELGELTSFQRRDGSDGPPTGEMGIMIEQDWRLEGRKSILCGSSSNDHFLNRAFSLLSTQTIVSVCAQGRLAEIDIKFSNGVHCVTFSTLEGQPGWAIFDRTSEQDSTLIPYLGEVRLESSSPS